MKKIKKPIAFTDNTLSYEEGLPLPYAHYPGHYGAFIGFSAEEKTEMCFCACAYEAIESYILLRRRFDNSIFADAHDNFILSAKEFPRSFVESMMARQYDSDTDVLGAVSFQNKICHECNSKLPEYRYCHEMYGSVFQQNYGWYVKKQAYGYGIDNLWMHRLEEKVPDEIELAYDDDLKDIKNAGVVEILTPLSDEAKERQKKVRLQNRTIRNLIENDVRKKFGHKNIGEAWTSETILYYLVKDLYPTLTIKRHLRPDYLDGLELDIFIKELNIGIEYQGLQHFKPVEHWGGEEAFKKLVSRDKRKNDLCNELGIHLVHFNYDENLSKSFVKTKIKDTLLFITK